MDERTIRGMIARREHEAQRHRDAADKEQEKADRLKRSLGR